MFYIRDGRIKFAVYYVLSAVALTVLVMQSSPATRGAILDSSFILVCALLGVGLGIDVLGATTARFQLLPTWSARCMWAFRTGSSHTMVAILGMLLYSVFRTMLPGLEAIIGITGLVLVLIALVKEGSELTHEALSDEGGAVRESPALEPKDWLLVMAVSVDAAVSVPAQSTLIGRWSNEQLVFALLLIGLVVGLCAVSGGAIGAALSNLAGATQRRAVLHTQCWGFTLEVLVLGYIGWSGALAPLNLALPYAISAALVTTLCFFGLFGKKILNKT